MKRPLLVLVGVLAVAGCSTSVSGTGTATGTTADTTAGSPAPPTAGPSTSGMPSCDALFPEDAPVSASAADEDGCVTSRGATGPIKVILCRDHRRLVEAPDGWGFVGDSYHSHQPELPRGVISACVNG